MRRWSGPCSPCWAWCAMCSFIGCRAIWPTACGARAARPNPMTAWPSCGGTAKRPGASASRNPEAREANRLLLEDEAKFIDLANSPLWLNREEMIYGELGEAVMMRRVILGLCAALLLGAPAIAPDLSQQAHPPGRRLLGRRRQRPHRAHRRGQAAGEARPAHRGRQQARRAVDRGGRAGRQGPARRLHAAGGAERADDHQSRRLRQAALRIRTRTLRRSRCSPSSRCCWWSAPTSRSSRCAS